MFIDFQLQHIGNEEKPSGTGRGQSLLEQGSDIMFYAVASYLGFNRLEGAV
jgi:hypothetical protein